MRLTSNLSRGLYDLNIGIINTLLECNIIHLLNILNSYLLLMQHREQYRNSHSGCIVENGHNKIAFIIFALLYYSYIVRLIALRPTRALTLYVGSTCVPARNFLAHLFSRTQENRQPRTLVQFA